jgi:hypothetical protein
MSSIHPRRTPRALLGVVTLVLAGLAFAAATGAAGAAGQDSDPVGKHHATQRLVVRGEATVNDAQCDAGVCLELTDGSFRGSPVGTGAYNGSVTLRVAELFPNGEGGVCAPIDGRIVLGAGTPDRLVLAVSGDSCQDGAGNPATSSFTGLAQFAVKHGTGTYAGARGYGLATFAEDAADRDRMTLIGRISR